MAFQDLRREIGHHQLPAARAERADVGQRARRHQAAAHKNRHPAAQRFGIGEDVRAEKHRAAAIAQLQDEVAHLPAAQRIQPGHRLIEEDHVRIVEDGLRDAHALEHPLGEFPQLHPALGADAHFVQQRRHARAAVRARVAHEARKIGEQLFGGEVIVKIGAFGKVADAPLDRHIAHRPAENFRAAGRGKRELHQQLQRGGLARAIGAEKSEHFALLDRQRQPVQRAIRPRPPESD